MAIDYKITFIIREENEIYQIYSLNNKYRNQNFTYIDFGDCRQKLKENAKLDKDDDIIISYLSMKNMKTIEIKYNDIKDNIINTL